jgi:hypothetical protein
MLVDKVVKRQLTRDGFARGDYIVSYSEEKLIICFYLVSRNQSIINNT